MEKKNTGLKVLVGILIVLVLGLSSYIVYDKVLKEDNNTTCETTNDTQEQENEEVNNIDIKEEVKNKFEFVFNYLKMIVPYCGEVETSDKEIDATGNYYFISTQFSTYDEMLNYLKTYMTEDLLNTKKPLFPATNKDNYLEEDGKLYCKTFGKGDIRQYEEPIIDITSSDDNKITATIVMESYEAGITDEKTNQVYQKINITLEKIDNNYIITSYEVQD